MQQRTAKVRRDAKDKKVPDQVCESLLEKYKVLISSIPLEFCMIGKKKEFRMIKKKNFAWLKNKLLFISLKLGYLL